jgi:hypothetical protein
LCPVIEARRASQVLSQPLLEDRNLFKEVATTLNEIQRSYIEMDKLWVDEVRRASRALSHRRLDPEDIDRWQHFKFREGLEQNSTEWGVRPSSHCRLSVIK